MNQAEKKELGMTVVRPLELLIGMRSIAAFLKVGMQRVKELEKAGAPIVRDELGILRAEKTELWHWVKSRK